MFIGHYTFGIGAKKVSRKPSLGTYIMAVSFLDLLWPLFLLLGVERVNILPATASPFERLEFIYYPYTHSLLMTAVWATVFAGVYYLIKRDSRAAILLWFGVASHWALDFIVHKPDLPLAPGCNVLVGLGVWDSAPATIIIESAMFIAGIYLYLRSTRAKDKTGIFAFWGLIAFILLAYASSLLGPPPPDTKTIGWFGLLGWLGVAWGYWADRHRESRAS